MVEASELRQRGKPRYNHMASYGADAEEDEAVALSFVERAFADQLVPSWREQLTVRAFVVSRALPGFDVPDRRFLPPTAAFSSSFEKLLPRSAGIGRRLVVRADIKVISTGEACRRGLAAGIDLFGRRLRGVSAHLRAQFPRGNPPDLQTSGGYPDLSSPTRVVGDASVPIIAIPPFVILSSNNLFELQNKNSGLVTEALQFKPKVWKFFVTFGVVLGLPSFTLDEFVQALHDYTDN
ncbi:putative metal-nicotianamine transporter YSL13 [Zea mays]|uniref:Putative metal-nicotianamine transporter YSL13 n=1 Tax=Zea mays TaxID=4577 RepID=A0A3L6DPZ1_MAIZE|nr:putative metal-nicotianamine transporter YSL13 [Zea mays]